ncbi:MAG: SH3 domain-containing protein [Thermotogaceae bacterium]|nr:SH3 domain-containing protein [Thermotogaceae bacterium]
MGRRKKSDDTASILLLIAIVFIAVVIYYKVVKLLWKPFHTKTAFGKLLGVLSIIILLWGNLLFFLTFAEDEPVRTPGQYAVITAESGANVRTGPSINDSILTSVPNGASLALIDSSSGWYRVKTTVGTGYVSPKIAAPRYISASAELTPFYLNDSLFGYFLGAGVFLYLFGLIIGRQSSYSRAKPIAARPTPLTKPIPDLDIATVKRIKDKHLADINLLPVTASSVFAGQNPKMVAEIQNQLVLRDDLVMPSWASEICGRGDIALYVYAVSPFANKRKILSDLSEITGLSGSDISDELGNRRFFITFVSSSDKERIAQLVAYFAELGVEIKFAAPSQLSLREDIHRSLESEGYSKTFHAYFGNSKRCRCLRCGHEWSSRRRGNETPANCPKCGSGEWGSQYCYQCRICRHIWFENDITSSPGSKPSICPCCENRDWFGK